MIKRIKKLKKIRIHREGSNTIAAGLIGFLIIAFLLFQLETKIPFWLFVVVFGAVYGIVLNFYRCPVRRFSETDETEKIVVAPADGKIVVIEEVDEHEYFNVHANWFPVDGKVKFVKHQDGNFHKAWLPKASEENERTDTMITTPEGQDILCRQIAGAMARRIVTYAKPGEDCYIDEHLGFIKLGSRVDVFLPIGTEVCVEMGQITTGDQTIIAKLK